MVFRSRRRAPHAGPSRSGGFTLLEIAFVIAIFAVMASIVLFRFRDFGTQATLDNLAQDVALHIVEAQKAAIAGSGNINITALGITPNYGVYFTPSTAPTGANKKFTLFTDTSSTSARTYNGDACTSTPTAGRQCVSETSITTGDYVSAVCYNTGSGSLAYPCLTTGSAHISFTRPFPDATMKVCTSVAPCTSAPTIAKSVYIEITSGANASLKRTIVVTALGQVRVHRGPVGTSHP